MQFLYRNKGKLPVIHSRVERKIGDTKSIIGTYIVDPAISWLSWNAEEAPAARIVDHQD
jgi:hypothetical protein